MDGTKLTPERVAQFFYSNTIKFSLRKFYERQRSGDSEETEISFFTVFKWETIALIFIANIISSICISLLLKKAQTTIAKFASIVVQGLFLLCLTVIVFHHGAGFQGNNVIIKPGKETTFPALIDGLHDGSREFWTYLPNFVSDDVYDLMIGSRNFRTVSDSETLLTKICDDPRTVTGQPMNFIMETNLIDNPCPLVSVKVSPEQAQQASGLETYAHTYAIHYMFSRETDRRIPWAVNKVLARLFSQDRIDDYWTPRVAKRLRHFKSPPAVTFAEFGPMNLLRVSLIFYIFIGLCLISFSVFLAELVLRPSPRRYRISSLVSRVV